LGFSMLEVGILAAMERLAPLDLERRREPRTTGIEAAGQPDEGGEVAPAADRQDTTGCFIRHALSATDLEQGRTSPYRRGAGCTTKLPVVFESEIRCKLPSRNA